MPTGHPNPPLTMKLVRSMSKKHRNGCTVWTGRTTHDGWPVYKYKGKYVYIHRWIYERKHGPIPKGMTIDHTCHKPSRCKLNTRCPHRRCLTLTHLECVTNAVNSLRGGSPLALKARQTHCIHGHPLSGDNLYITPKGQRNCRACRRKTMRLYYLRQKG